MIKIKRIFFIVFILQVIIIYNAKAQWTQTSGPPGGKIWSLASDARGNVFAGSVSGLYHSADSGLSWTRTNLPLLYYWAIAINSDSTVFAIGGLAQQFFRSTDNGLSWEKVNFGNGDPWWVITDGGREAYLSSSTGMYHSVNNGDSWTLINSTTQDKHIFFLSMDTKGFLFGAGYESGVYVSADSGITWNPVQTGSHIYALHSNDFGTFIGTIQGIYRTTNLGTNWQQVRNGLQDTVIQCIQSVSKDLMFTATSGGIYFSTNQGDEWSRCSNGIPNLYMLSVWADLNGTIFAGNYWRGVYRSIDNGYSWVHSSNGLANSSVKSIAFTSKGTLICTSDYGIHSSTDKGLSWSIPLIASGLSSVVVNANDSIYVGGNPGIYLSENEGISWKIIGLTDVSISSLYITKKSSILAITSKGLQRSTDRGQSWNIVDTLGSNSLAIGFNGDIWSATFNGVYKSTDDGINWTVAGLERYYVFSIGVTKNNTILASIYTGLTEGPSINFMKSTNNGSDWTWISDSRASNFVVTQNGWTFSDYNELSYSTDNGNSWVSYNNGLDNDVTCLASSPDGHLYAGTSGGGVYRSVESLMGVSVSTNPHPSRYFISQNYPNPFNPSTTIEYDLPKNSKIKIIIYDALGKEVQTLVNENKSAGRHHLKFDAGNLSSGIYFCKFQSDEFTQTKKLILMK